MRSVAKVLDFIAILGALVAAFAAYQGMRPDGGEWTAIYGIFGLSCAVVPHVIASALHRISRE